MWRICKKCGEMYNWILGCDICSRIKISNKYHKKYYIKNRNKILKQKRQYNKTYTRKKGKCSICNKPTSRTSIVRCKSCKQLNEDNPQWKGVAVQYNALHTYIKRRLKKPKRCQKCNKIKKLDLANISQKYKRNLNDWEYLCRKCHMINDGRLDKLNNIKRI